MARRSMSVYLNEDTDENHVRTFGGNGYDVREWVDFYKNMTKEQFLQIHPKFAEKCEEKFELHIYYS